MPYLRTFARGSELRLRVGVISDIHEPRPSFLQSCPRQEDVSRQGGAFRKVDCPGFDAAWRECFYEPFEPFSVKEVKGYRFRGVQYGRKGLADFVCKRKHLFEEPVRSCDGDGCF